MPVPIASICFAADMRLQILQALSIDRMMDVSELDRYIVVVNDPNEDKIRTDFKAVAQAVLSAGLISRLEILTSQEVLGAVDRDTYYDQQAIKLKLADLIDSRHWLMLDAKNHLVHPASLDIFIRDSGSRVLMNIEATKPYWERYLAKSLTAVEAECETIPQKHLSSVTPIMLDTQIVRDLTHFLEGKYQLTLPSAMRRTGGTEFLLYYAWILKNHYEERFEVSSPPFRTLFASWPQTEDQVREFILGTGEGKPFLGVHRKRIGQLRPEERGLISAKWHEHLLLPWEDSAWFLSEEPAFHD